MTQPTTTTPNLLDAALWHDPDLSLYLATAREQIDQAAKDPTFKATQALIAKLPGDRPRRMVERLTIRAYAQGSAVARRALAELRRTTKDIKDGARDELTGESLLERAVSDALVALDGECRAVVLDLLDVATAAVPPGRELATVRTEPMRRVAGLGYVEDEDTMVVPDGRGTQRIVRYDQDGAR